MRQAFRILAAVAICLIGTAAASRPALGLGGLTISPPLREVTLGPGLIEAPADITLQNNTDQTVRATLKLIDLRALGEYGGNTLDKAGLTSKYDLANWLSLPGGNSVVIGAQKSVQVHVVISNRSDLSPGGHYGAVVISTSPDSGSAKGSVSFNQQLVSLLFIKKLGGESYGLQLQSSNFKHSNTIPQQVSTEFRNTGNVHVVPRGYIEVTDPVGKLLAKGTINEDSQSILPGASRKYTTLIAPMAQSTKRGTYRVTTYYRYDGEKEFRQFSESYNIGTQIPWKLIVIGAAGLLIIAAAMRFARRRKRLSRR